MNAFEFVGLNITRLGIFIMAGYSILASFLMWRRILSNGGSFLPNLLGHDMYNYMWIRGAFYDTLLLALCFFLLRNLYGEHKFYCYKRFLWVSGICLVATFTLLCVTCHREYHPNIHRCDVDWVGFWSLEAPEWLGGDFNTINQEAYDVSKSSPSVLKALLATFPRFARRCFTLPILALFSAIYFPGCIRRNRR